MYLKFYSLNREPFSLSPDHHFLYLSDVHKEGLAYLRYGLIQRKGFVVITGEVGTGKTTLLNALLAEIPQKVKTCFISNPRLDIKEFFYMVANNLGLPPFENKAQFLVSLKNFLKDAQQRDYNVVLIVDEAHCLSEELLEEIRLLSNLETPEAKLMNIILVGQPEFEELLARPSLRALQQRITLKYTLRPLNREETKDYIKVRLTKAGALDLGIFSDKAIDDIYEFSGGIPRVINLLADHALLTGFVKDAKVIDDSIIRECAAEIGLSKQGQQALPHTRRREPKKRRAVWGYFLFFCVIISLALGVYWYLNLPEDKRQLIYSSLLKEVGRLWEKLMKL